MAALDMDASRFKSYLGAEFGRFNLQLLDKELEVSGNARAVLFATCCG